MRQKLKGKSRGWGNTFTLVFEDKGGTIQRADWLPVVAFKRLVKTYSSRQLAASPMQGK